MTDREIAFKYALMAEGYIKRTSHHIPFPELVEELINYNPPPQPLKNFDEHWDAVCELAKRRLHKQIDGYFAHERTLEYFFNLGILINTLHKCSGIPREAFLKKGYGKYLLGVDPFQP